MEGVLVNGGRWEGTDVRLAGQLLGPGRRSWSTTPASRSSPKARTAQSSSRPSTTSSDLGRSPARRRSASPPSSTADEFNAAAAAGSTALFIGGNWQLGQLQERHGAGRVREVDLLGHSRPDQGPAFDRHRRLDGRRVLERSGEGRLMCAASPRRSMPASAMRCQQQLPTARRRRPPQVRRLQVGRRTRPSPAALVDGRARPGVPIYPEISNQIQVMMGDVLAGAKTPEAALDAATWPASRPPIPGSETWHSPHDARRGPGEPVRRDLASWAASRGAGTGMTMSEAAATGDGARSLRARACSGASRTTCSRWLLPVAILLGVFYLYPIIDVFRLAFTNASLRGGVEFYTTDSIAAMIVNPVLPDILVDHLRLHRRQRHRPAVVRPRHRRAGDARRAAASRRHDRAPHDGARRLGDPRHRQRPDLAVMLFSEAPFGAINSMLRLMAISSRSPGCPIPNIAMVSAIVSTSGAAPPSR